jgi:hypothetical protein
LGGVNSVVTTKLVDRIFSSNELILNCLRTFALTHTPTLVHDSDRK